MKIILAASGGGHLEEIKQLDSLKEEHTVCYLIAENEIKQSLDNLLLLPPFRNSYRVRRMFDFLHICICSLFLILKEKPDVVICTGAAATYPFCWLQKKMRHKKVIYIESFARKTDGSKTGKMVYKFADHFIVQRKELLSVYPNAIYGGMVF